MRRYLSVRSLDETLDLIRETFPNREIKREVDLEESVGRITASPIFSSYSVPEVHLCAMDGIAVRSEDTLGASEQNPVTLTDAVRVNTGNVLPAGYDAVVMIEDTWVKGDAFSIRKAVSPWQHVRPAGEDIAETEMVLPSHHFIRPHEIGALATYGITRVPVLCLNIGLIPTGSELIAHGTRPAPGQVVESNTVMAAAWLMTLGADCHRYPITPDDPDRIREMLSLATRVEDVVIISAGSSAGTRDYTADIISELGDVIIHGVAIKPGKPVIIGRIAGKPVIGMPGYPLSALTVIREIIIPLIAQYGFPSPQVPVIPARLTSTLHSEVGVCEYVLLATGMIGDQYVASPQSRGSGIQMSAVRSNAYMVIPAALEGFEAGTMVQARLLVPPASAASALLINGSHDPALDYLRELTQRGGVELHSIHSGSMGGLISLKRGDCHAAPMHLLSPEGEYNLPYIRKYLPGKEVALVCIAEREQGIASIEGLTLADLPSHRFINRQRGSGTRILLDQLLSAGGIDKAQIAGYEREVTTHTGVALAIRTGEADAGMCVYSAARAMGLSFVPVGKERYELVLLRESLEDARMEVLLDALRSREFREILLRLGGYDPAETGVQRGLP